MVDFMRVRLAGTRLVKLALAATPFFTRTIGNDTHNEKSQCNKMHPFFDCHMRSSCSGESCQLCIGCGGARWVTFLRKVRNSTRLVARIYAFLVKDHPESRRSWSWGMQRQGTWRREVRENSVERRGVGAGQGLAHKR
jgi:hypothetical protein